MPEGFEGELIINNSMLLCIAFGSVNSKGITNQLELVYDQPKTAHTVKPTETFEMYCYQ